MLRTPDRRAKITAYPELPNSRLSPLFLAAIEATEEAIYNSLCMAHTVSGFRGVVEALPLQEVKAILSAERIQRE